MELRLNRAEVYALEAVSAKVAEAAQALTEARKLQDSMLREVMEAQGLEANEYHATNLDSGTRKLTLVRNSPEPLAPVVLADGVSDV